MLVSDFSFDLPDDLIACYPLPERDSSRLMVLDREQQHVQESQFSNIADWLKPGDLLVLNNTRVIPARLFGHKDTGGRLELFLLEQQADNCWICMVRSSKPCRTGQTIRLDDGMTAKVLSRQDEQSWLICFDDSQDFNNWLQQCGQMPIPPYLNRPAEELDRQRYQTVYAAESGAVAAPTAGLHFTEPLLQQLQDKGIGLTWITLHVGLGTFLPVRVSQVEEHVIHKERYQVQQETVDTITSTRQAGGRIVAVGTTACRTLEYLADENCNLRAGQGEADIFIYPGYSFKLVDALITNFHLPESTLLMLVSAFAGQRFVMDAYRKAVEQQYRFYSYGDAMLII